MKFLKIVLFVAVILAIAGIFMPQSYTVKREITIAAQADDIRGYVESMDSWERWVTWDEVQPPAENRPAQMQSGVGSGIYFSANSGSGWFVIKSDSAIDGFEYTTHLDTGNKATGLVRLVELGPETKVEWIVKGSVKSPPVLAPYIAKSKEFLVGSELNQNLKNLKKIIEQEER